MMENFNPKHYKTMKNLFKTMMLVAVAAMGFTACSNEAVEEVNPAVENKTYTMTFVADAPNTRTSVAITDDVATYSWSEGDVVGFYYVDTEATDEKKKNSEEAVIADSKATFALKFEAIKDATSYNLGAFYPGDSWVSHSDTNPFNNVKVKISGAQTLTKDTFDPKADLMMAKPFMGINLNNGDVKTLEFTRIAAVGKMNLKLDGMVADEVIKSVRFALAEGTHFIGPAMLDLENSTYSLVEEDNTNAVTLSGELAANANGTPIFFTCFPGEYIGAYTIEVTTDQATYSKTGTLSEDKPLSFTAGNVLSFNATVGNRYVEVVEEGSTVDVLNREFTGVPEGTAYKEWKDKSGESGAIYAGQSAGDKNTIQLRTTNNNSGIVTTTSGGYAKKVVVAWNAGTANGRTLNIYGKNTAYTDATDLYDNNKRGTLLGTIVNGTSTELEIDGDYEYIGMRSSSSAMYIDEIEITWGPGDPREKLDTPDVNATAEGKNVTVTWNEVDYAGSYTLTYGNTTIENATSPYEFVGTYSTPYEFSVVAVPSDNENYRESDAGKASTTTGDDPNAVDNTVEMNIYANKGKTGSNTISWTSDGVTVTNNKASSTTAIRVSDSDHYRVYAKSQFIVSVAEGTISKVVITCTTPDYAKVMKTSFENASYTASVSGSVVTVTGSSSAFTMTATAQTRLNKVAVTYTK